MVCKCKSLHRNKKKNIINIFHFIHENYIKLRRPTQVSWSLVRRLWVEWWLCITINIYFVHIRNWHNDPSVFSVGPPWIQPTSCLCSLPKWLFLFCLRTNWMEFIHWTATTSMKITPSPQQRMVLFAYFWPSHHPIPIPIWKNYYNWIFYGVGLS